MPHSKMVATRRTTRVSSPVKESNDEPESGSEPLSTIRTTRRRTIILTVQSEAGQENDSQAEESTASAKPVTSPRKATRSFRRRPTEHQQDSTHEADVSESESCCSEVSDVQAVAVLQPTPRRTTRPRSTAAEKQEASKVECPSASVRTQRKSTRGQKNPSSSLKMSSQDEDQSEADSCSSVASLSKVSDARMQTRSSIKTSLPSEEAGDSCSSTTSAPIGSTIRRSTRSRATPIKPIPINLDQSETPRTSRVRAQRAKEKSVSEDQELDVDDCQSGPSSSPSHRSSCVVCLDSEVISAASMVHEGSCRVTDMPCSSASDNHVNASEKGDIKVILEKLYIPPVISEVVQKDKTEDVDVRSQSGSEEMSDAEEMETEGVNNTVIAVDGSILEDADITLTLEKDDEDKPTLPTGGSVMSNSEVVEPEAKENQTEQNNAPAVAQQSSCSLIKGVIVSEAALSDPTEEVLIKNDQQNILVEHKSEEGLDEDKKKAGFGDNDGVCSVDQDASEVPECSSKTGTQSEVPSNVLRKKTQKNVVSLLDSSEDEEDSDDGLSDDEDSKLNDQDMEGEVPFDESQPGPSEALEPPSEGLFVIDTHPGLQPSKTYYIDRAPLKGDDLEDSKANEEEEDFVDEDGDEEEDEDSKVLFTARKSAMPDLSSSIDPGLNLKDLGGLYISFGGNKSKTVSNNLKNLKEQKKQEELLKKSVIGGDFEKKDAVPPYKESKHVAKLKRREERSKTTGDGWFNMKAPELTEDLKNDLKALKMRSAMDPKRFYKKNDREGFPKYFQVGTVMDNPVDFYHSRIPKKDRKRTIVEELLADAEFRSFNKRKYQEIMTEKAAEAAGKMKKHKFHKKK